MEHNNQEPVRRLEQLGTVPGTIIQSIVGRYSTLLKERRRDYSEPSGFIEGRLNGIRLIFGQLGQEALLRTDPKSNEISLDGITVEESYPLTYTDISALLRSYESAYRTNILAANTPPPNILDRLLRGAKSHDDYWFWAKGMNRGKLEELQRFLGTIGCNVQMDNIQRQVETDFKRDPNYFRERVRQTTEKSAEESLTKLKEVTQGLGEVADEIDLALQDNDTKKDEA